MLKITPKLHSADQLFDLHYGSKDSSLLYQAAIYFASEKHVCVECIKSFFIKFQSATTQRKKGVIGGEYSIQSVLKCCPGFIHIVYSTFEYLHEIVEDTDELRKLSDPHSIIIIFPWALEVLNNCHYFELDASFKGMKPYKYCVSQAIYFNESLPLSISIAPQENIELYQSVFNALNDLNGHPIEWKSKSVLSDMGGAIISTCKTFGVKHFFCHRHIMEHFNPNSVLGIYVRKLLKCYNYIDYENLCSQILPELEQYEIEKKKLGTFTEQYEKKSKELRIMLSGKNAPEDSNYHYKRWALWERQSLHVGRCSNHAEGFHSVINFGVGKKKHFIQKLSNLIDLTIKHAKNFKYRQGNSIHRKRTRIIEKIIRKLNVKTFNIFSMCKPECQCNEDIYNCYIYGSEIPCKHQIFFKANEIISQIKTIIDSENTDFSLNDIICSLLIHIKSKPLKSNKIKEFIEKEFSDYCKIIDQDILIKFVEDINSCFNYDSPEFPELEIDWNLNKTTEEFVDISNDFIEEEEDENDFPINDKVLIEEEEFWSSKYRNLNEKFAKKILYETIIELHIVYPKFKGSSIAYSICFDEYNSIINFDDDLNFYKSITQFKISCWKEADKYMKNNKFFTS